MNLAFSFFIKTIDNSERLFYYISIKILPYNNSLFKYSRAKHNLFCYDTLRAPKPTA